METKQVYSKRTFPLPDTSEHRSARIDAFVEVGDDGWIEAHISQEFCGDGKGVIGFMAARERAQSEAKDFLLYLGELEATIQETREALLQVLEGQKTAGE